MLANRKSFTTNTWPCFQNLNISYGYNTYLIRVLSAYLAFDELQKINLMFIFPKIKD